MLSQVCPIDLGVIKFGKSYNFKIPVRNDSSNETEITNFTVGCGSCTKARLDNKKIKPKEEFNMDITFTPGTTGKQTKFIYLYYPEGSTKLEFTADVPD